DLAGPVGSEGVFEAAADEKASEGRAAALESAGHQVIERKVEPASRHARLTEDERAFDCDATAQRDIDVPMVTGRCSLGRGRRVEIALLGKAGPRPFAFDARDESASLIIAAELTAAKKATADPEGPLVVHRAATGMA